MIYKVFRVSLKLKTPSEKGKKINFKNDDNQNDLFESLNEFNMKYRSWNKRLLVTKIENNFFNIILVVEKHKDKISTREIRTFTAYLNKEKNWYTYSRDTSKLFEGVNFTNISLDDAKEIISNIQGDSKLYMSQKEDIQFLLETKNQSNLKAISEEKDKVSFENLHDLSDEQALAVFDYLLKTKKIGNKNDEKEETILQIKDMLLKWI